MSLHVDPDVAQYLVDLGLWWRGGKLQVKRSAVARDDFMDTIKMCMLSVFRFQRFTDSRWITIGESCRSLVASLALGLSGLVHLVRADPRASDYYISGFAGLDEPVLRYAIVASVVANVCDGFLLALLEDDRVGRRCQELKDILLEDLQWVASLRDSFWHLTCRLLANATPKLLRTWCLHSATIVHAFITHKVIRVAEEYPWRLASGDIEANLANLSQEDTAMDPTSGKIRALVRSGFPVHRIVTGVQLLAEAHWTSTSVEQGHGSAATLHRLHKQYGANMLCQRSMLHMLRHLLFDTDSAEKLTVKEDKREHALLRRKVQHLGGRQLFLAELMAATKEQAESWSRAASQAVMSKHGALYALLAPQHQQEYENRAMREQTVVGQDIVDELQGLRALRHLRECRDIGEQALKGTLMRMSNCRFVPADFASMAQMWLSSQFSGMRLRGLRDKAMVSPAAPSAVVIEKLQSFDVSSDLPVVAAPRPWISCICRLRDFFNECALVFADEGQEHRAYLFIYATQQPLRAEFAPLYKQDPVFPHAPTAAAGFALLNQHHDHCYTIKWGECVDAKDIAFLLGTRIYVLPHLSFHEGAILASHADLIPLLDFVKDILPAGTRGAAKAAAPAAPNADRDLLVQFPWLCEYMPAQPARTGARPSSAASAPAAPKELSLDDADIDEAFQRLNDKRAEWRAEEREKGDHFKVSLLGGAWTQQHKGVPCDAVKAFASGKGARGWCVRFGLPRDATFSLRKFGDEQANGLALAWCARLEYFYALFLKAKTDDYKYTVDQVSACPPSRLFAGSTGESAQVQSRLKDIMSMQPQVGGTASSSGLAR